MFTNSTRVLETLLQRDPSLDQNGEHGHRLTEAVVFLEVTQQIFESDRDSDISEDLLELSHRNMDEAGGRLHSLL